MNHTRISWRQYAEQHLQQQLAAGFREPGQTPDFRLDVELLLQYVLDCSRTSLYAWPDKTLESQQIDALEALLQRRAKHEPLAYLVGSAEFHSRDFLVNPDVLVPRDDTETLVRLALEFLSSTQNAANQMAAVGASSPASIPPLVSDVPHPTKPLIILDIGAGSGAIAITLAAETGLPMIATDRSAAALKIASLNAERHAPGLVSFLQADWLSPFEDHSCDLILSNPPYIAYDDPHLLQLAHEPTLALVSGPRGLDAIERIINDAVRAGMPGCPVMLEHGYDQGPAVRDLMQRAGLVNIRTELDLAGHERVTLGRVAPEAS